MRMDKWLSIHQGDIALHACDLKDSGLTSEEVLALCEIVVSNLHALDRTNATEYSVLYILLHTKAGKRSDQFFAAFEFDQHSRV